MKKFTLVAAALLSLCIVAGAQGRKPADSAKDAPKETEKKEETDIKEININNGDEINGNNLAIKKDDNENINISKKEEENNNEVIEEDII